MMHPSLRETVSPGFFVAIPPMSAVWPAIRASKTWLPHGYRAEISQMMVCTELGITVSDYDFANNAAYLASWLEKLRSDRKEIFRAAADAQRIADYLLAFHPDYAISQAGSLDSGPLAEDGDAAGAPEPMPAAA
jgi:hypothetical protein